MLRIKSLLKKAIIKLRGKFKHIKKGVDVDSEWYGNEYGGFYVNIDAINENSIVYSFGIGEDVSFDMALINQYGCTVFGFDPTPKSIKWVKKQKNLKNFKFSPYGLAEKSGMVNFYLPSQKDHISGSLINQSNVSPDDSIEVETKSFGDITAELGHKRVDILKMDIEGSEYDVLESILETGIYIDQILIEFHERFFDNGTKKTINAINRLKSFGYEIFAVSNSYQEVSFAKCCDE